MTRRDLRGSDARLDTDRHAMTGRWATEDEADAEPFRM
jgi:hypothetical protein